MPEPVNEQYALRCVGIAKQFKDVVALADADLAVATGSIHALVGENGAGKSTLINILGGLLRPDRGELLVYNVREQFRSPLDAAVAGIGVVHQHFLLADALTVAENIALGRRRSAGGLRFRRDEAEADVAWLASDTGLAIDPAARVGDLPVGLRQRVEILKALSRGARILLLDEPTAVLAPPEVDTLFNTLRKLRDAGRTIVIVTHKLDEVFALASNVTVLRKGQTVFAGQLSTLTSPLLAEKMIGREPPRLSRVEATPAVSTSATAPAVLEMQQVEIGRELKVEALVLRAGEIVGIAGVEGNGQDELAEAISGTRAIDDGICRFAGLELNKLDIPARTAAGLAVIPPDRQRQGLILELSLTENLHLRRPLLRKFPWLELLDHYAMRQHAGDVLTTFDVVPPNPDARAGTLSGGNQQKVVIARELERPPKLVLACNPTRGLDVAAAAAVQQRLIQAAREQQAAVLLISSDLDEVLLLADRIGVLYRGKLRDLGPRGTPKEVVGRAMVGADERGR